MKRNRREPGVCRDGDGSNISAKGPGPPALLRPRCACLQVDEFRAEGPGNTAWSAGTKPAGRHAYAVPAVPQKDTDPHSDSSPPRNSQLTLNKALDTFKSISSSRAENNKTKHAVCKMTSSSFVRSGYSGSVGSRTAFISLSFSTTSAEILRERSHNFAEAQLLLQGYYSWKIHAPYLLQLRLVHRGARRGRELGIHRPTAAAVDVSDHLEWVSTFVSTLKGRDTYTRGRNLRGTEVCGLGAGRRLAFRSGRSGTHSSVHSFIHSSIHQCRGGFGMRGNRHARVLSRGASIPGRRRVSPGHGGHTRQQRVRTEGWPLARQRGCLRPRDQERPDGGDIYAERWVAGRGRHVENWRKGFRAAGTAGAKACGGCDVSEDNPESLWQETGRRGQVTWCLQAQ